MEIKRKIYSKLLKWKQETDGSKALLIEGARRIGKSTVAEEFGRNEYKSYVLIDFNKASNTIIKAFDNLNDLDTFFQIISFKAVFFKCKILLGFVFANLLWKNINYITFFFKYTFKTICVHKSP